MLPVSHSTSESLLTRTRPTKTRHHQSHVLEKSLVLSVKSSSKVKSMLWRSVRYLPLARTVHTRNMAGITQQLADVAIAAKDAVVNAVAPATADEPKDDNVNEFGNNLSTKSGGGFQRMHELIGSQEGSEAFGRTRQGCCKDAKACQCPWSRREEEGEEGRKGC